MGSKRIGRSGAAGGERWGCRGSGRSVEQGAGDELAWIGSSDRAGEHGWGLVGRGGKGRRSVRVVLGQSGRGRRRRGWATAWYVGRGSLGWGRRGSSDGRTRRGEDAGGA